MYFDNLPSFEHCGIRVTMQDYGEFVPIALKASKDDALRTIGNKLDLFPYGNHFDAGIEMVVKNGTHMLVDTYSYLMGIRKEYGVLEQTYMPKEQVNQLYLYLDYMGINSCGVRFTPIEIALLQLAKYMYSINPLHRFTPDT